MTLNEHLVTTLHGSLMMLKMSLADLSDADLLTRPVPSANHANWQLGHLLATEHRSLTTCGAAMPELPAGFAERYTKQTAGNDDAAAFATKDQLLELFEKVRAATIAWTTAATAQQFAEATPETIRRIAPNISALIALQNGHASMHLGQIQVLRRKLGKPVLF